jgi:GT2 family glycosyltransferase
MQNHFPLVSIITLNYRQAGVTCEFLESCRHLTYPNYEILVCDMKSDEDPRDIIHPENYPHSRLYCSGLNRGFAGGNNWGMQFAKGEYILLLNNDTEVTPDLIENLLIPFEIDKQAGAVSPKINYFDPRDKIQYAGFNKMNTLTGRTKTIGDKEKDRGQYDKIRPTFGAHGAAMMVKKEVIDKVGRFPERFFLYYEEWDWSTRIQRAGYKIYFQGLATVYHKESMSVGKENPMKEYYLTRNRILYMRRNAHGIRFLIFSIFFTLFTLPKTTLKYLFKGDLVFLKAFLKGINDNLRTSSHSPV